MTWSTIVNKREFRVFAMKRSGHHAVINWLLLHFTDPVYFLNNCGFLVSKELFNFSPGCDRNDRPSPYRKVCILAGTSSVYYNPHSAPLSRTTLGLFGGELLAWTVDGGWY